LTATRYLTALVNGTEPTGGFADIVVQMGSLRLNLSTQHSRFWRRSFTDSHGGSARVIDFAPRFMRFGRFFCPPMLIRRIEPMMRALRDHGARAADIRLRRNRTAKGRVGSNHLRYRRWRYSLRVTTDMPVSYLADEVEFLLDRPINLIIGGDETIPEAPQCDW
jgi:hypothetical protein